MKYNIDFISLRRDKAIDRLDLLKYERSFSFICNVASCTYRDPVTLSQILKQNSGFSS